ncbi:Cellulose synthase [Artemisia annua]|uniref:Cellulose synthase n=1 Tax=Artemisia annua TaxID=35608 RepID=A0A2U1KVB3_ARTAN|nr:Cellulose synthase [Artemisia annua]
MRALYTGDEYVAYTVHIPPTPDHQFMANSQESLEYRNVQGNPSENRIKDTVFTGSFNSKTRAHTRRMKSVEEVTVLKSKLLCQMNGCDEKLLGKSSKTQCECGFRICAECYLDCCSNGSGVCPGCKELFRENYDESDNKDEFQPMMHEENHTVNLLRKICSSEYEAPPSFNNRMNRPLTQKVRISAAILSPYRLLIVLRLAALGLFLTWRILHPNMDAIWPWLMSVICEVWFAFSWLMDQLSKLCPVTRSTESEGF